MDFAQDRPVRQYIALLLAFVGTVFVVVLAQALETSGLDEHTWWLSITISLMFFGPAWYLITPLKTSTTRALIRSYIGQAATTALLRRRAFVTQPPAARPDGVTPREAEFLAAAWMAYLGAPEARATQYRNDGGIDVVAQHFVAQVKNRTDKVPVTVIREIQGASHHEGKQPLFFAASSYTAPARAYARDVGLPLFIFRAKEGRLVAANPQALHYLRNGLHVPMPEALRGRTANRQPNSTVVGTAT